MPHTTKPVAPPRSTDPADSAAAAVRPAGRPARPRGAVRGFARSRKDDPHKKPKGPSYVAAAARAGLLHVARMVRALLLALAGAVRCAAIQTGIEKAELRCGSGAERVVVDLLEPWKDKPLVPNLPDTHPDLGSSWSRRASSRKAVTTTVDYQLAAPLFVESPTMELRARHSVWRASDYCPGAIQSDGRGTGCGTFVRWDEETGRRGGGATQPDQVDLNAVDGGGVLVEHRVPRPVVVPQLADCSIRIKPTATARLANWEFALTNIDATQLGSTSASMWSIWELGHAGLLLDAKAKNGVMAQIIVIEPPEAETCPATLKGKAVLKFQLLEAVDLDAQLSGPRATEFTTSSVAVRSGSGRTGTYEVLGGEKVPLVHWDRRPQTVSVSHMYTVTNTL